MIMKIKITNSPLTVFQQDNLLKIISAGLEAADPRIAVASAITLRNGSIRVSGIRKRFSINRKIHLIGAGKASIPMTQGLVDVLGDSVKSGILISKTFPQEGYFHLPEGIEVLKGNHPIPGEDSLRSTRKLVESCSHLTPDDLVICLISGGGSALMTLPFEGIKLEDIQLMTRELLRCGAVIGEINTLRKHLDRIKGGGLARLCSPAEVITLAISDVIGNPPEVIASGPTVPDESTYDDAVRIIQKYQLQETLPASILKILDEGKKGTIPETLKAGDDYFQKCSFQLIASNEKSVSASLEEAGRLGFETINLGSSIHGEAAIVGEYLTKTMLKYFDNRNEIAKPICMVGGGETTVSLKGEGFGGRNLEVALAAVKSLAESTNSCLVALASDGEDGPTDAAGAVITGKTYLRSEMQGLNPARFLAENDSYRYFEQVGGMIRTGSTGTNVMDLFYMIDF